MSDGPRLVSGAEREARRELLREALERLPRASDPHAGAQEVLRALDAYLDLHRASVTTSREPPVADFSRSSTSPAGPRRAFPPALWFVLGTAVVATVVVAFVAPSGWPIGVAVAAIWVAALFVLASAS
jgi:hypothetical protein